MTLPAAPPPDPLAPDAASDTAASLFAPPAAAWQRLSPRYVVVRQVSAALGWTVFAAVAAVAAHLAFGQTALTASVAGAGLVWAGWRVLRARRWVAAWGWAERDADLSVTHGLWTRQLTIVPFAHMQIVKVTAGPLARWQGLAAVSLVTAAAHSDVSIPGLAYADAVALRDRMIELSDATGAGL